MSNRHGPDTLAGVHGAGDRDIVNGRSDPSTTIRSSAPIASGPSKRMRLLEWRPMRKNTLYGFCVVELPSGLIIRDVAIHAKAGKWWASLPARPVLDSQGRHVSNHGGHRQYAAFLGWRDRELADAFSTRLVELVRAAHPDALDAGS